MIQTSNHSKLGQKSSWTNVAIVLAMLSGSTILLYIAMRSALPGIGTADYLAYWSASHLLSEGENFTDDSLLLQLQKEVANVGRNYALKTWNPPWVLAWLLPYALIGFRRSATLWLSTNLILLFVSVALSWRLYVSKPFARRWFWLPLLAAAIFPATVLSLRVGQTSILVLAGLVGFLWFYRESMDAAAGAALSLTMTKPHLVYLTVPLILLVVLKERRWRVFYGFGIVLFASMMVVFVLRPSFPAEYLVSSSDGELLAWANATLTTFLHINLGWIWLRLIGLLLLPLAAVLWWRHGHRISLGRLVDISLLISVITMPFGWSYDFVVLLLPLARILLWLVEGVLGRLETAALSGLLLLTYILFYYQRVRGPSELYYLWVPLAVAAMYGWVWYRQRSIVGYDSQAECQQTEADSVPQ